MAPRAMLHARPGQPAIVAQFLRRYVSDRQRESFSLEIVIAKASSLAQYNREQATGDTSLFRSLDLQVSEQKGVREKIGFSENYAISFSLHLTPS